MLLLFFSKHIYANDKDIYVEEMKLLPVSDVFLNLGYDVEWMPVERKVIVKKEEQQMKFIESEDLNTRYVTKYEYPMIIINSKSYFSTSILDQLDIIYENKDNKVKIGEKIKIGEQAPEFTLKNNLGEEISLSDFKGQKTIICFWATWCPYCKEEVKILNEMSQILYEKNISIILINVDDGTEQNKVKDYIKEYGFNHKVLMDGNSSIKTKYNVDIIPYMYILDEEGKISHIQKGLINKEKLLNILEEF